ncbi:MAG: peptidoglycan DD-metalloendopeptidase family protein [Phycisphaerae bacterium]
MFAILALGLADSTTMPQTAIDRFTKVLEPMVKAINARDYEDIRKDWGEAMLKALSVDKTRDFFGGISSKYGRIVNLGPGRLTAPDTAVFLARFERNGSLDIKMVLDNQGMIIGLWLLPPRPDLPVIKEHLTRLDLPFGGPWQVAWGGDTKDQNQHHDVPNQRYAFDFLVVDKDGKSFKGEGKANDDYYAFGREILAPAGGTVTEAIDGVRDNTPGSMNPFSALGNAVFIQHRPSEVSVLAHLKMGSVKVKAGDKVTAGQVVGLCGNSGNSSEAHLHYHLQNTPVIQDGTGIKCCFENVALLKDGKTVAVGRYSPVRQDVVATATAATIPATAASKPAERK